MAIPVALDPAREDQPNNLPPDLLAPLQIVSPLLPFTNPGCPSFLPPVCLLHRHLTDPVMGPEEPTEARCGGASLRAWAVRRYSGAVLLRTVIIKLLGRARVDLLVS